MRLLDVIDIRLIDVIDIVLVAYLLYKTYKILKGTNAIKMFFGILSFIVIWLVVTFVFRMQLMGTIMNQIVNVGAIALIVLFQEEIRRSLSLFGSKNNFFMRFLGRFFLKENSGTEATDVMQIVMACRNMAKAKVGALIVMRRGTNLKSVEITGEAINATISTRLIENIFFKNSPLHDGAMVVDDGKIVAAGCILPVSHRMNVPKELGLRHRAALGISEKLDVLCIIISEETGRISVAQGGEFMIDITSEELEALLSNKRQVA